jgi:hypothetical protein
MSRKFKMYTGCKTYGFRDVMNDGACDDPDCLSCLNTTRNLNEAFLKEVEKLEPISPISNDAVKYSLKEGFTREQIKEAVEYVFKKSK